MGQVVFIASLGHSGSTLLDLLMGAHPRMVGLGEIEATLRLAHKPQHACTCGAEALDCPIWGRVLTARRAGPDGSLDDGYRSVIEAVRSVYGDDHLAVDSSKHYPVLEWAHRLWGDQLRVVFLLKDVRAFVTSAAALPTPNGVGRVRAVARKSRVLRALQWYRENQAYARFLEQHNVPYFQLGYEELCLQTEQVLAAMCEFLGIEPDPRMHSPQQSQSHILRGNRLRHDSRRGMGIVYDNRWFYSWRTQAVAATLPAVMAWNTENVYRNIRRP